MHPDLAEEQAYFDTALEHRERARAQLDRAPEMTTDPAAAAELRRRIGAIGLADPDEGVAFGRIDRNGERLYIGKNAIWDDKSELLVINWQAPAAAPFYTATPQSPLGLDARRTYRCESNKVLDIDEMVFSGLAEAVAKGASGGPVLGDALLDSLARNRSGELEDIVATIQAHQYEVISRPIEQLLVVQGGPGTGKTVVGLHRVSWLLYNLSERLQSEDVLVVGPNPAFVRYIRAVLPKLGDEAVVQRSISELGPRVRGGRVEAPMIRKLKGDRRMIELIVRGLRNRQRVDTSPVELTVNGRRVTLDAELVKARATQLERRPHNEAHAGLREFLIQEVQAYLGRRGVLDTATLALSARGPSLRDIDKYLERVWPKLTPQAFVLELLSTRRQLEEAAAGIFDEHEITLLSIPRDARVGTWEWSIDDIPILDAADFLLNGPQRTYEYIVVDEAQDLSPMQLLSIARRSRNGWMTVLGDLAQATAPAALGTWNEVADHLYRQGVPASLAELRLGYRLPTEVHEVAMRLLRKIAPGLATPEAVRPSGQDVVVTKTTEADLVATVVSTIRSLLGTGLVGVITAEGIRPRITAALDAEGLFWAPELQAAAAPIVVLSAEAAKGLEFDNVVVVEPHDILDDHGANGQRALFVALTRCTRRLSIVHHAPLPSVLELDGAASPDGEAAAPSAAPTAGRREVAAAGSPGPASTGGDSGTAGQRRPLADAGTVAAMAAVVASASASGAGGDGTGAKGGEAGRGAAAAGAGPANPASPGTPAPAASGRGPAEGGAGRASDRPAETEQRAGRGPALGAPASGPGDRGAGRPGAPVGPARAPEAAPAPSREPDVERRVAGPMVAAIAQSLASTLESLVQPSLMPEVVEELARIVAKRVPGERPPALAVGGSAGVAVELPADLVARAQQAVAEGRAASVSAYVASALEDKGKLDTVSARVNQMLAEAGSALGDGPAQASGNGPGRLAGQEPGPPASHRG